MDDITIGVTEYVNNILVSAQPNDQTIDITVTETVETVLLDVSTTVQEVTVTATQNVIVENITVDYVNNENNIDINVTDGTQDVTLNVTPTLVEINILRSGGEVNILQFNTLADFPATGSSDYFYLAKDTNKLYRWTGSAYAEISATSSPVWGQIIGTLSNQTDLQNALNLKAPIASPTFTGTVSGITKTMVGLGAVDNTSDLDKPISTATQSALNAKQPLDGDLTSIAGLTGTAGFLKKNGVNSFNLDNTTYLSSISSSDVTTALGYTPENVANKGVNSGYASLDGGGKVPSSQLPSYVDDVIEVSSFGTLPATGETGKIYITLDTNKIYRWSGSVYVEVSSSSSVWGGITGTLSNQTDLQNALNAKQDDLNGTGFVKASGTTISYDNTTYYPASNPNGYTTNVGTVTSVAMSVPSAFSVSGSPITSSGTLAVTATGNTTQYIAGDGSLVTFPTIGTAGTLTREVRNTTGATLTKGTVIYISGATGNKPTVSKAIATGDSTSAQTFGLVQADIANNANGNVVCIGDITGIDTSAFTEGVQLYLSSTTAGAYTVTKQLAPAHLVYIGIVTRAHPTLGQVEVNIQNGYELYELHDVSITSEVNNQGLFYEASTDLWKNKSIATVLGYTPANDANVVHTTGSESISGVKSFTTAIHSNILKFSESGGFNQTAGFTQIGGTADYFNFINGGNTKSAQFTYNGASSVYTLPATSGTLALTSDLAGYVATTGNQTIAGDKTFSGGIIADGDFYLKQDATYIAKIGYTNLFASGNTLVLNFGSTINATLNFVSVTASRSYAYPDASGTLALTSDLHNAVTIGTANGLSLSTQVLSLALASTSATGALSSTDWNTFNNKASTASLANYLPLSGGTLTGALSGTSATFSSTLSATGNLTIGNAVAGTNVKIIINGVASKAAGFEFHQSGTPQWYLGNGIASEDNNFELYNSNGTMAMKIIKSTNAINFTGAATFSSSVTAANLNAVSSNPYLVLNDTSGSAAGAITFQNNGTQKFNLATQATSNDLGLYNNGGTNSFNLYVKYSTGNVGIGTTAPSGKLHVKGDLIIERGSVAESSTITMEGGEFDIKASPVGYNMRFFTGTGGTGSERMRITSGGELYWSLTGASGGSLNSGGVLFRNNSGKYIQISTGVTIDTGLMYFYKSDGAGSVTNTGSISTSGNLTLYNTTSDYRLKQDFKSYIGLDIINKIKTYDYQWKSDNTRSFGVIAHELQEVLPFAVFGVKDGEQLQQVDYSKIVPVMVQAIKELKAELDTLKNK